MERDLHSGSIEDCADPLLSIKHHNRFLCHGSMEKFLQCGSVERVLHHGSMDNCADPLLGIEHHNRFLCCGSMEKFLHHGSMERVLYNSRHCL